jgi:chromosome segregation ATPase
MKIKFALIIVSAAAIFLGGLSTAWAISESEMREVEALRKELAELQVDETKLDAESKAIEARKATLLFTRELVNGSLKNIEKDQDALVIDAAKQEIALKSFDIRVAPLHDKIRSYNYRCGNNFKLDHEQFSVCQGEKAYLDTRYLPFSAEAESVSAWGLKINEQQETITMRREAAKKQTVSLNNDALKWARRKAKNNNDVRSLQGRENAILLKIRGLFLEDSFLDDLKAREKIARGCARINDAMTATRCLDRIYHGSR